MRYENNTLIGFFRMGIVQFAILTMHASQSCLPNYPLQVLSEGPWTVPIDWN